MPNSRPWSNGSARCRRRRPRRCLRAAPDPSRIEWRPSRLLTLALATIGLLAAVAVLASDLAAPWSWIAAALAAGEGLRLAVANACAAPRRVDWPATGPVFDGRPLDAPRLRWRGPLAVLEGRDAGGATVRLAWYPDTLPPAARRELRLAAALASTRATPGAMAP